MQLTRFVERSFHLESQDERDEWVQAYEDVSRIYTLPISHLSPINPCR